MSQLRAIQYTEKLCLNIMWNEPATLANRNIKKDRKLGDKSVDLGLWSDDCPPSLYTWHTLNYLSKLQNIFVQIAKYICLNCPLYFAKFNRGLWSGDRLPSLCTWHTLNFSGFYRKVKFLDFNHNVFVHIEGFITVVGFKRTHEAAKTHDISVVFCNSKQFKQLLSENDAKPTAP